MSLPYKEPINPFSLIWRNEFDLKKYRLIEIHEGLGLFQKFDDLFDSSPFIELPRWIPISEMKAIRH
jgi:hypothetical protein